MPHDTFNTPMAAAQPALSELLRDFAYHQVNSETAQKMADLRAMYYALAERLYEGLPRSRERSLALTALEESSMRAIQCLAVSEGTPIPIGEVVTDPGVNAGACT